MATEVLKSMHQLRSIDQSSCTPGAQELICRYVFPGYIIQSFVGPSCMMCPRAPCMLIEETTSDRAPHTRTHKPQGQQKQRFLKGQHLLKQLAGLKAPPTRAFFTAQENERISYPNR